MAIVEVELDVEAAKGEGTNAWVSLHSGQKMIRASQNNKYLSHSNNLTQKIKNFISKEKVGSQMVSLCAEYEPQGLQIEEECINIQERLNIHDMGREKIQEANGCKSRTYINLYKDALLEDDKSPKV